MLVKRTEWSTLLQANSSISCLDSGAEYNSSKNKPEKKKLVKEFRKHGK
jgi:hypothetical protein